MKALLFLMVASFLHLTIAAQSSEVIAAVKNVVLAFQDDFNDGDFTNAVNYTTKDWEHINPGGGIDKGRDTVLKLVRSVHQTFLKGVSMTVEDMAIRLITPDVAVADVVHKVSTYKTPDGITHENERLIKTYVMVKQQGKWLLAQDHATTIQSAASARK